MRDDELGAAEAMYDPNIVGRRTATDSERTVAARFVEYVEERFDTTLPYARVDLLADESGEPLLLELELIEPNLFLDLAPGSADVLAEELLALCRP